MLNGTGLLCCNMHNFIYLLRDFLSETAFKLLIFIPAYFYNGVLVAYELYLHGAFEERGGGAACQ